MKTMLTTETYYVIMLTLSSYRATERGAMAGKHAIEGSLLRSSTGIASDRYVWCFLFKTRCDRTTASVLARSANDAANLEMGPANDAARLRTASVRQDQRKCLLTSSVRQNERHLSAIERHQPTPLRVFLPVLPTTLALLLTSSVRQNERHY